MGAEQLGIAAAAGSRGVSRRCCRLELFSLRVAFAHEGQAVTAGAIGAGGAFRPARTPPSIGIVVPVIQAAPSLA